MIYGKKNYQLKIQQILINNLNISKLLWNKYICSLAKIFSNIKKLTLLKRITMIKNFINKENSIYYKFSEPLIML